MVITQFVLRAMIAALGLWLATEWVGGISIDRASTLLLAGLLLGIVNSFVRPLIVLLTAIVGFAALSFFLPLMQLLGGLNPR